MALFGLVLLLSEARSFRYFPEFGKFPPLRSAPRKFALRISTPLRKAAGSVNLYLPLSPPPHSRIGGNLIQSWRQKRFPLSREWRIFIFNFCLCRRYFGFPPTREWRGGGSGKYKFILPAAYKFTPPAALRRGVEIRKASFRGAERGGGNLPNSGKYRKLRAPD